jgi:hypothetical protein
VHIYSAGCSATSATLKDCPFMKEEKKK